MLLGDMQSVVLGILQILDKADWQESVGRRISLWEVKGIVKASYMPGLTSIYNINICI